MSSCKRRWPISVALVLALLIGGALLPASSSGQQAGDGAAQGKALDQAIVAESRKDSQLLANLTHLSDIIGPRLTGSLPHQAAGWQTWISRLARRSFVFAA